MNFTCRVRTVHGKPGHGILVFQFPGLVMEFSCWSWKIVVCVVRKLLPMSKQGQCKVLARNARTKWNTGQKVTENEDDFDNFRKWQLNLGHGIWEAHESTNPNLGKHVYSRWRFMKDCTNLNFAQFNFLLLLWLPLNRLSFVYTVLKAR